MRFTAQFSHSSHVSIRDLIKPADSSKRRVLQVKFVSMAEHAKHSFLDRISHSTFRPKDVTSHNAHTMLQW